MHNTIPRRHSLPAAVIVALLAVQALPGLLFSIFELAGLLAPGQPVIVTGTAILTGPVAGAALMVALASPLIAWGVWMSRPWAHHRVVLLEILSLGIGALELTEHDVNREVALARMAMAVLILLCLYTIAGIRRSPLLGLGG